MSTPFLVQQQKNVKWKTGKKNKIQMQLRSYKKVFLKNSVVPQSRSQ
jgi:hypothetical protein